jgi:ADP-heptose:LPS heptosyltransferase/O-antigen ligase
LLDSPLNLPLLGLGAALLISSILEGTLNPSLFGLRKIGLMLIFFMTAEVFRHPVTAYRNLNLFIIGGAVCSLWAILAHGLHWDAGRARSFSGDYMAAGGMFMMVLILSASRFLHNRSLYRWFWLGCAAVSGVALLLTYTRSSWIGAAFGLLLLGALRDWRLPAIVAGVLLLFFLLVPQNPVLIRLQTLANKTTSSNVERRYMWQSALKMIGQRPLLGYGVDNLARYYSPVANPKALEQRPPHVHNTLLQLAINGGLLAVGCYLWWMTTALLNALGAWAKNRVLAPERAGAALGIAACVLAFFVNGLFEYNFGTSQVIAIFYFLLGLLPAYAAADPGEKRILLPNEPRLLFIRPRFRGDVLLASPVARMLKRDYPKARVDLLTEPACVGAAGGEPAWDRVFSLPRKGMAAWWQMIRELRKNDYVAACDLFGNPRSVMLAAFCGARVKIGPRVKFWDMLLHVQTQPHRRGLRPAWESYFDILRLFGMKMLSQRPRWVVSLEDDHWIKSFLKEHQVRPEKIIGFFAGGSHPAKRWPLANFLELAGRIHRELGIKSLFVFGPLEKDLKNEYMQHAGKMSLSVEGLPPGRLAALWKHCRLVVSNDAFPMHLGPAVGTPTIGLFGPGEPEVWFPYPEHCAHHALHAPQPCWPCHQDQCDSMACWEAITVDQVLATVKTVLEKDPQACQT